MKQKIFLILLAIAATAMAQQNDINYYIEKAPFDFGELILPIIPDKTVNIKDFGGVNDGKTLNTEAFAKAINALSEAGGGKLVIPAGIWITGPIEIKSRIEIHAEQDALIQFTNDITQYPIREMSKGKFDVTPPLWGDKIENVAFTGKGIFDGAGEAWRPVKKFKLSDGQWIQLVASGGVLSDDGKIWWPSLEAMQGEKNLKILQSKKDATKKDYEKVRIFMRPMMFALTNVTNMLIDGPTFRNSPKFVINPKSVKNLTIRNTTVYNPKYAQNGDGIDISASQNVIIYNTKVSAGDDGICMKSSGDPKNGEAKLRNIIIADCVVNEAHGGFVIGSNTDGGMENIFVSNCYFSGSDVGIRVKSNTGRGGDVRKIYIDNIRMRNIVKTAILFDTYYADVPAGSTKESADKQHTGLKIPFYHDFHITNISCNSAGTAFFFRGLPDVPIQDIYFKNVNIIKANQTVEGEYASNIYFDNVKINGSRDFKIPKKLAKGIIIEQ